MTTDERTAAQSEHQHHHYRSNEIPWWLRGIWIGFWIFAVYYTIKYLVPALQLELFTKS